MNEIKMTRIGRYQSAWNRSDLEKGLNPSDKADEKKIRDLMKLGDEMRELTKKHQQSITRRLKNGCTALFALIQSSSSGFWGVFHLVKS